MSSIRDIFVSIAEANISAAEKKFLRRRAVESAAEHSPNVGAMQLKSILRAADSSHEDTKGDCIWEPMNGGEWKPLPERNTVATQCSVGALDSSTQTVAVTTSTVDASTQEDFVGKIYGDLTMEANWEELVNDTFDCWCLSRQRWHKPPPFRIPKHVSSLIEKILGQLATDGTTIDSLYENFIDESKGEKWGRDRWMQTLVTTCKIAKDQQAEVNAWRSKASLLGISLDNVSGMS